MLVPTTIDSQYMRAREDDISVLIVGAGIAGVTAAQMLRRDGRHPVLVERARVENVHAGYMLALMPMVDPALDDLGIHQQYRDSRTPLRRYGVRTHTGRPLRVDSLESILARYGDYRGIGRAELIDALTAHGCDVSFETTVTLLRKTPTGTVATLSTGDVRQECEFDLVIVADGIHSTTRALVLGGREVGIVDTKWGGWVAWAPEDANADLGEELLGGRVLHWHLSGPGATRRLRRRPAL